VIARLQALLRWCFMRVEGVFNAAFGDRLNPLYHLGAITFTCFWLVAGSGLYLYAFFETGVAGAYDSVEALTVNQWYAGGILRSIHRYASDAMVLTLLLHMVRHFAFDRMRGFRWFSWVSGVALIWGVYVSGIVGYMLPWDRLAQYVIVAAFEWLDWLPGFGGTLIRNFIYPSSVNDRFFSLLAFMHIGIPLVVLLLMWVHVQRVPKAKTSPPRPVMASVIVSLLVLSLVSPVVSQGGAADLATSPTDLRLDWFYLIVFPLLYLWPLARVWTLLLAASVLLTLVPWLPPRLRRVHSAAFRVSLHDSPGQVLVRPGETILEAGLREGVAMPYECRNGACGVCVCTVMHGSVDPGQYQQAALPPAAREQGRVLMCCARPLSDLEIDFTWPEGARRPVIGQYTGRVDSIERLGPEVIRLMISLPGGQRIGFAAGQYINIILPDGQRRAYSFANAPHDNTRIELHVRRIPGGRFTGHVFEVMQVGDELSFEGPMGSFTRQDSERPILFVAGATGFAPVKSIVEDCLWRGIRRPMSVYWGVRQREDLYLAELAETWQRRHDNLRFVPVVSEGRADDGWTGRRGMIHEAMLADHPDMTGFEVYVCGSVKMVEAAVPAFIGHGLAPDMCFTDAFVPALGR
jgi:CDP-4-dehydro-6-deoxyglucose reductase